MGTLLHGTQELLSQKEFECEAAGNEPPGDGGNHKERIHAPPEGAGTTKYIAEHRAECEENEPSGDDASLWKRKAGHMRTLICRPNGSRLSCGALKKE